MTHRLLLIMLLAGLFGVGVYTAVTDQATFKSLTDLSFFIAIGKTGVKYSQAACLQVAALANACGVGGGAFFVPMFNVLLGFSLKGSTALSQAVVTGGALAGFVYSSSKRHPDDHEQSLIDFDLALILTPMLLLGITAGVLINAVMPNWLITLLLVLLLTWLTVKTINKGRQLHSSEVMAQQEQQPCSEPCSDHEPAQDLHSNSGTEPAALAAGEKSHDAKGLHIQDVATDTYNTVSSSDDAHPVLASSTTVDMESGQLANVSGSTEEEVSHQQPAHQGLCLPWRVVQFAELTCLWAAFLGLQYGKGCFSECSWQYALICCAQAVFSLTTTGLFIFQAHNLTSVTASDLQVSLLTVQKPVVSQHSWSMSKLLQCVSTVLVGGMVAGMLGFGGGMVLTPLMLEMGIHPLVSSATSSVMVLFSASAATFSFATSGKLNYQYAVVYGIISAVASIFGVAVISTSVRRSGKGSRIVFTLASIIGVGALMQAVFGGLAAVHDIQTGRHLSFLPLC